MAPGNVVLGDKDQRPLDPADSQRGDAFLHQLFADAFAAKIDLHRKVVDQPATSIVAAKHRPHHGASALRDPAKVWIASQILEDAFLVIALCDLDAVRLLPELDDGWIVISSKGAGGNLIRHAGITAEFASRLNRIERSRPTHSRTQ